jgi:hypothetical protein
MDAKIIDRFLCRISVLVTDDMGHVDPSLAERQRMLKKARLADSLNDQLSHRPGPLELIKKNILHTEEPIERAVKGNINYVLRYLKYIVIK